MAEYQYFDGESFITFNIVYATEKEVQLAITNRGDILPLLLTTYTRIRTATSTSSTAAITTEYISKILRRCETEKAIISRIFMSLILYAFSCFIDRFLYLSHFS